jgi:hypothetical protein
MEWIDEKRRKAFENLVRGTTAESRGHLDRLLPDDVKERALPRGNELILSYGDALMAVAVASEHQIAVLGFDAGEVTDHGFQSLSFSGYDREIEFIGEWSSYVSLINRQAERWIREHPLPENHGYILTSASERELQEARIKLT